MIKYIKNNPILKEHSLKNISIKFGITSTIIYEWIKKESFFLYLTKRYVKIKL